MANLVCEMLFLSLPVPNGPPTFPSSSDVTRSSVRLNWQQPEPQHRNGIITHYKIRLHNLNTSTYQYVTVYQSSGPYTVRNLRPFTQYNWAVAAVNINGTGPYSSEYTIQTLPSGEKLIISVCYHVQCYFNFTAPSAAPSSIRHETLSPTSIRVWWTPPSVQYRNGIITSYHLELNDTAGLRTTTETSHVVHNLRPSYTYGYRVAAFTVGLGPFTSWRYVTMPTISKLHNHLHL